MKEKIQLVMTIGLPASGKSTWAKEQVAIGDNKIVRVNKDDIRAMVHAGKWSKERESMTMAIRDSIISEALHRKQSVIVDDTNFAPVHEKTLRALAEKYKAEFVIKRFDADVDECVYRDAARVGSAHVGEDVIRKMYTQYVQPNHPKLVYDPKLPNCIICDLDGTLADFKLGGHRTPYNYDKCDQDDIVEEVRDILYTFYLQGDDIIFMSGREEKARAATLKFLERCSIEDDVNPFHPHKFQLLFRKDDDHRKDTVIKKEIYQEHILGKYNVRFVLDDRTSVVRMWRRELGLKCLQVAEGDF